MKHDELNPHINTESLADLLPEEDYKALEDRYLSHKEVMHNNMSVLIFFLYDTHSLGTLVGTHAALHICATIGLCDSTSGHKILHMQVKNFS